MKILLDDISIRNALYPFTATRSVVDVRIGILTIREKWELIYPDFIVLSEMQDDNVIKEAIKIPANIIPSKKLINRILDTGNITPPPDVIAIDHPWQIFELNSDEIKSDFELITKGKVSNSLSKSNNAISPENIFIEEGAIIEHCILNASKGFIYVGKNVEVMEGSMLRGPIALCEGSVVKMGTKIYGATTIGPNCTVGGEIKNSILLGYSNKAHDGYLGDSVIGEWCNLGAGTSNSNLKNTAGAVSIWDKASDKYILAGMKCGLLMGDYTRAAINTSFNTGTVTGVCCNIFGESVPPKYIPAFSLGNEKYKLEKALTDIDKWKKLKGKSITEKEIKILTDLFNSKN